MVFWGFERVEKAKTREDKRSSVVLVNECDRTETFLNWSSSWDKGFFHTNQSGAGAFLKLKMVLLQSRGTIRFAGSLDIIPFEE